MDKRNMTEIDTGNAGIVIKQSYPLKSDFESSFSNAKEITTINFIFAQQKSRTRQIREWSFIPGGGLGWRIFIKKFCNMYDPPQNFKWL